MRILSISAAPPLPLDSGMRKRNWQFLRALGAEFETTVVTWDAPSTTPDHLDALRAVVAEVVTLPAHATPLTLPARLRRRARQWLGDEPAHVQALLEERDLRSGAGRERLATEVCRRHAATPYDVVLLWHEEARCLPLPRLGLPLALHRFNVFGRVVGDMMRRTWRWRAVWAIERSVWRRFDRRVMEGVSLCFTPTPESAAEVAALAPHTRVVHLPNGVELPPMASDPAAARDLAYVGWMGYYPNVDAVRWFVRECWPELRSRFPDATFRIIGRDPAPAVARLAGDGVQVVGSVPDVPAACAGVRIGVVPLWGGMGIKTKTLEFMAMGLPVVSTPVGAEGIGAGPDDGLIVATDAPSMVAAIAALMEDGARATRLGRAARAYVAAHHSWAAAARQQAQELWALSRRAGETTGETRVR